MWRRQLGKYLQAITLHKMFRLCVLSLEIIEAEQAL